MQMMTAVGKIQETKLLQDKHSLQLTVKINSQLETKKGSETASSSPPSVTHTDKHHTPILESQATMSPCDHGHRIKALYCKERCGRSRANKKLCICNTFIRRGLSVQ